METDQMHLTEQKERPTSTFSRITNFVNGNTKKTKVLLKWIQTDEQKEWTTKAVDFLVKKLKTQPNGIKNITDALQSRSETSKCVTIPQTTDGRVQILNTKTYPHFVYCRIWRWPDLESHHELKAIKSCEFPFSVRKTSNICVNPYHYDRVENKSILPPILVRRVVESAPEYTQIQQPQNTQQISHNMNYANNGFGPINGSQCSSGQNSPMSTISTMSGSPVGYQQPNYMANATSSQPYYQENNAYMQQPLDVEPVHYIEQEYWANVSYYELNHRVGEQFQCNINSYSLIVDGFTNPSCNATNRFCLGQLSNVNRNSSIETTRRHIGKGVHVFFESNELFITCLSESPVFVHSLMTNQLSNSASSSVWKVMPNNYLKIFDTNEFANILNQVVNAGFEETFALTKMCTIRISFVKGWGGNYHRQDVTSIPCWIEIHLNGPLKWLDNVLNKMNPPAWFISSHS